MILRGNYFFLDTLIEVVTTFIKKDIFLKKFYLNIQSNMRITTTINGCRFSYECIKNMYAIKNKYNLTNQVILNRFTRAITMTELLFTFV